MPLFRGWCCGAEFGLGGAVVGMGFLSVGVWSAFHFVFCIGLDLFIGVGKSVSRQFFELSRMDVRHGNERAGSLYWVRRR